MEEIAQCIDRQFGHELVNFMRMIRLVMFSVVILFFAVIAIKSVRSGRLMTIPPPLVLPFAFFLGSGALMVIPFMAIEHRRVAEADAAIDRLEEGDEEHLSQLVKGRPLLLAVLQRRHVRRGRLSDYLSYLNLLLPKERSGRDFFARWDNSDLLREIAEASRDCERLAPWQNNSFLAMLAIFGFSQGFASSAETRFGLNVFGRTGLQVLIVLVVAAIYFGYVSARRKPGYDRFRRVVGELSDEQLKDLVFDPHLVGLVRFEEKRRSR